MSNISLFCPIFLAHCGYFGHTVFALILFLIIDVIAVKIRIKKVVVMLLLLLLVVVVRNPRILLVLN